MPGFFEKFILGLEAFSYSIRMSLSLAKLLISPQEKVGVISQVHHFHFLVSCLHTFNPLLLLLKSVVTLFATTYRKMESK